VANTASGEPDPLARELESARSVLVQAREELFARAHVVATGIGMKTSAGAPTGALCIVCSVAEKRASARLSARERVPRTLGGIPTDVVYTGPIRALAARTDRQRPAPGGVSIGHLRVTAGTLGCLVRRRGERFLLSNNHVLANENDARTGDPILQPGPEDGGRYPQDQLADLSAFVPLAFLGETSGRSLVSRGVWLLNGLARLLRSEVRFRAVREGVVENLVDAAIARPLEDGNVSEEILEVGSIVDLASAELGMPVKKSGRTTGLTTGRIQQVEVTVDVQYGRGRVARFRDQVMAGAMSQGGDSGSAVLDAHDRLVGLLFAGSESTTVINRIEHVFTALGLEP
jgi:hypothetical protein